MTIAFAHSIPEPARNSYGLSRSALPGDANPMTYQAKTGKQYVAIVAGDTLNVFTLP